MTEGRHRYRVFISYNHRDRAWAEWLEQKIEGYRVPRGLESKSQVFESVPRRLKPVFRDRSTGSPTGLSMAGAMTRSGPIRSGPTRT